MNSKKEDKLETRVINFVVDLLNDGIPALEIHKEFMKFGVDSMLVLHSMFGAEDNTEKIVEVGIQAGKTIADSIQHPVDATLAAMILSDAMLNSLAAVINSEEEI